MKKYSLEIVIPTYNGLALLKKHLPAVIKHTKGLDRIIVVDNGSTDGTRQYLETNFPDKVFCLHNEKNLFFPIAVNQGFRQSGADLVVLLNNDVHPQTGYLDAAIRHFDDENIFAVTFNEASSSSPVVSWQGKLQYTRGEDKSRPYYSAWASGGSAVFRKSVWEKLGGFDEVYTPGYWEDIDLGWRAWKAGYRIVWEPKAQVLHQHESSFNLLNQDRLNLIKQRNELIFNWKNITDSDLRRDHLAYLFHYTLAHPGYLKVIFAALPILPKLKVTQNPIRTDQEILSIVNQPINDK